VRGAELGPGVLPAGRYGFQVPTTAKLFSSPQLAEHF